MEEAHGIFAYILVNRVRNK